MALSDCGNCWETPCVCGTAYISRSPKYKKDLIKAILSTFSKEEKEKLLVELAME